MISKVSLWDERDKAIKEGEDKLNNQNIHKYSADQDANYGCRGKDDYWYGYKRNVAVCIVTPYFQSSVLNSTERLWRYIKASTISNKVYDIIEELEDAICDVVKKNNPPRHNKKHLCFQLLARLSEGFVGKPNRILLSQKSLQSSTPRRSILFFS
jgi:hypothetical protein